MGKSRSDGQNTSWGGGLKNGAGKGFAKSGGDYDAQRDTNERTNHYGPLWIHKGIRQAKGPLKGESAVNP